MGGGVRRQGRGGNMGHGVIKTNVKIMKKYRHKLIEKPS